MATISSLTTFIDLSPFWSSFFSQLLATFIVVIIGSFIAPPIINWRRRTKLEFWNAKGRWRWSKFKFTQDKDRMWKSILYLDVKNLGRKTAERFYWEIYIDKNISSELVPKAPYPNHYTMQKHVGEKFDRYYGFVEMPIFPLQSFDFVFEVRLETKDYKKTKIYYYFNTDQGIYPIWSWIAVSLGKINWLKSLVVE